MTSSGCCALGTCVDPECRLCRVVATLPQPTWTTRERAGTYAVPDGKGKQPAKHPSQTKRKRKALEAPGLRLR